VAVLRWPAADSLCRRTKKGKYEILCLLFFIIIFLQGKVYFSIMTFFFLIDG